LRAKHNNILLIYFSFIFPSLILAGTVFLGGFPFPTWFAFYFTSGTLFLICITMSTNHIVSLFLLFFFINVLSFLQLFIIPAKEEGFKIAGQSVVLRLGLWYNGFPF